MLYFITYEKPEKLTINLVKNKRNKLRFCTKLDSS